MSTGLLVAVVLGAGCYVLKSAGPLLLGGRSLPRLVQSLATLVPAALLAALVVASTIVKSGHYVFDARLAGLAAAAIALWRKANFIVVVLAAATVTAAVRAIGQL